MDMELFVILLLTVVFPICAVTVWIFGAKWLDMKTRRIETDAALTAEKTAQYAAKTEKLEQRVAVLERILTDQSTKLSNEIEDLREERIN